MHSAMFDSARGVEASKPHGHACVELSIKPREIPFSWQLLAPKKKAWPKTVKWCERTRRSERWTLKEEQECCCLSSLGSGDESVSSAIESDDRPHLSPEHCHLLPAVITRLLRRCSPQHLREGTSWRWPLHKFESCSRAWIHVDTLKITAKGQGKDSSASLSQWERTSRYPFVEWSKEKNRTLMAPVIARPTRRSV